MPSRAERHGTRSLESCYVCTPTNEVLLGRGSVCGSSWCSRVSLALQYARITTLQTGEQTDRRGQRQTETEGEGQLLCLFRTFYNSGADALPTLSSTNTVRPGLGKRWQAFFCTRVRRIRCESEHTPSDDIAVRRERPLPGSARVGTQLKLRDGGMACPTSYEARSLGICLSLSLALFHSLSAQNTRFFFPTVGCVMAASVPDVLRPAKRALLDCFRSEAASFCIGLELGWYTAQVLALLHRFFAALAISPALSWD